MTPPFPLAYLPNSLAESTVIAVLTLSLITLFAGSRLIGWLSFLVVGLLVGLLCSSLGMDTIGPSAALAGLVLGFLVGGFATQLHLPAGMGLAAGAAAFFVAESVTPVSTVYPLVAVVGFAYGFLLTDFLLPAITAAIGASLLFGVLSFSGLPLADTVVICLGAACVGTYVQSLLGRKAKNLFGDPSRPYRLRRAKHGAD